MYYHTPWRHSADELPSVGGKCAGYLFEGPVHFMAALRMLAGDVGSFGRVSGSGTTHSHSKKLDQVDTLSGWLRFDDGKDRCCTASVTICYASAGMSSPSISLSPSLSLSFSLSLSLPLSLSLSLSLSLPHLFQTDQKVLASMQELTLIWRCPANAAPCVRFVVTCAKGFFEIERVAGKYVHFPLSLSLSRSR